MRMSINLASQTRLVVGRQIADACAAEPSVVAVVCAGSTARGEADRWSDLEMLIVWDTAPTNAQLQRIWEAVGAQDPRAWA